ncbi:MAG: STAS/SEC14 domain-containing protein [Nannocystales bacterium]
MPKPERHFTDLPSGLAIEVRDRVLRVEGAGFVTRPMAEEALTPFLDRGAVAGSVLPDSVLVDLRNVSGYEAACAEVAQSMLSQARGFGVRRIAFVANSSILRTAAQVIAQHLRAPLHTFASHEGAQSWLENPGATQHAVTDPVPGPTARA